MGAIERAYKMYRDGRLSEAQAREIFGSDFQEIQSAVQTEQADDSTSDSTNSNE